MQPRTVGWLVFCCSLLLGMGGTMKQPPEYYRAQLQRINLSDGVSKEEAIIIAQNYLLDVGEKGCALSRPSVKDSSFTRDGEGRPLAPCWEVKFPTTWAVRFKQGLFWVAVHIDKKTGKVRVAGAGPDL